MLLALSILFLLAFQPPAAHAAPLSTRIVSTARHCMGTPYEWGGAQAGGFDCSGFVQYVYRKQGIAIPRMADEQYHDLQAVPDPAVGDLVFFKTYLPGPSHVGIYLGHGNFIHASSAGGHVMVSNLNEGYYHDRYLGARRACSPAKT